ncbi:MAG: alpha/beta fold hydrolase [Sulfurifustis sp.]
MASLYRRSLLVAGSIGIGAAVAWQVAAARSRRRQIVQGKIRPTQSVWNHVGNWVIHARVALPPQPSYAPPVVLVHGFGMSSTYFMPTAERLARRFIVYAPDLPGHGKSRTPRRALDIPQLADALIAWMEAKRIDLASLVGNSMGCQIAVDAAMRYPHRVDRLVLIGPTMDPPARRAAEMFWRFLRGGAHERISLNLTLARDYARMGKRLFTEFRFMRHDYIEDKLPDVRAPVMLVRGEKDTIVTQDWLMELARLARTDRIATIPDWGHAVNYSAPEELVATITPFLLESRQPESAAATSRPMAQRSPR